MKKTHLSRKLSYLLLVVVLLGFGSKSVSAKSNRNQERVDSRSIAVIFNGGYAGSESRGGMVDMKAEILFSLTANLRVGLAVGYLSDTNGMHMGGMFGGMSGPMIGGMIGNFQGGFSDQTHAFRAVPVTLNLYYFLPVNNKIDVYLLGGSGYYFGAFRDITTQRENAFGAHTGFGIDFKLTQRIVFSAESAYRFVSFKGFQDELHPGYREGMDGEEHEEGFWHHNYQMEEYHFYSSNQGNEQMHRDLQSFNISLNGLSLRAGIKFRF